MLHTKFAGNWSSGSGEDDFFKIFTIYRHGGHLGHMTWTNHINLGTFLLCQKAEYEI